MVTNYMFLIKIKKKSYALKYNNLNMYLQHVKINDIVSGDKMLMPKVMNKLIYKPGLESESTSFTLQRLSC